jgi:ABC-type Mn2+/Zn2+ transport system permease subunit
MLAEMFQLEFMRLAAVAGAAAALTLAVLGVYVVLKRVVFVGLTLANVATLGAALALTRGWHVDLVAILAALVGAAVLALLATPRRLPAESLVGWGFAAASAATILVLAKSAAGDTDAMRLLFGNVLAVNPYHAVLLCGVAVVVVGIHALFAKRFVLVVFDPETARAAGILTTLWTLVLYLTVGGATAAAVHETGALLAFALLTLPATASLLVTRRLHSAFAVAAAIGVFGTLSGLVLSFLWDLPTGPLTVALLAAAVPAAWAVGRLRRRRTRRPAEGLARR